MEATEVVELRADGSCPRCEGNYSQDTAPTPEANLTEYVMHFGAVRKGAIGGTQPFSARRKAVTEDGAWLQLYDSYEHITRGRIERA